MSNRDQDLGRLWGAFGASIQGRSGKSFLDSEPVVGLKALRFSSCGVVLNS